MKIFIESIDHDIWNAIVNGPYIPMSVVNGMSVVKSFDELSEAEISVFSMTVLQEHNYICLES